MYHERAPLSHRRFVGWLLLNLGVSYTSHRVLAANVAVPIGMATLTASSCPIARYRPTSPLMKSISAKTTQTNTPKPRPDKSARFRVVDTSPTSDPPRNSPDQWTEAATRPTAIDATIAAHRHRSSVRTARQRTVRLIALSSNSSILPTSLECERRRPAYLTAHRLVLPICPHPELIVVMF